MKENLFIGVYPEGWLFCDRSKDYKQIAFQSFRSLELEISDPSSSLVPLVKEYAEKMQARRGEKYIVSGSGQYVMLGGR